MLKATWASAAQLHGSRRPEQVCTEASGASALAADGKVLGEAIFPQRAKLLCGRATQGRRIERATVCRTSVRAFDVEPAVKSRDATAKATSTSRAGLGNDGR